MKLHPSLAAAVAIVLLALSACRPGAAEYTESEAPKTLAVDDASTRVDVRFAPGSSRLLPADAARLRGLAAAGYISRNDRVVVSAAGGAELAEARFEAVSHELAAFKIVSSSLPIAGVPRDHALINTGRYLVTPPPCPDWSKQPSQGFTNTEASNWGCADAVNLARMVWRPADLVEGVPHGAVYDVNSTQQAPLAVFAAGASRPVVPAGTVYNATPQAITNAVNVLGCPNPLATATVSQTGNVQGGQGFTSSITAQPCNLPGAPPPF